MKKTKGIVMRTSSKVTAIFTEKGDFLEIPTPQEPPVVGQTIEVNLNPKRLFEFHNFAMKYATAAVLLLALSFSVFFFLFIPNMAVASVALDINKGVELLINKYGKVIKAQDVNGGSNMLEGLSIKGLDVYPVVALILENANDKGILKETQNLILVSVVPLNKWGTQIIDTEKLRNLIRDEMTHRNISGSVIISLVNQQTQKEARQQGMTVNSYLIYARSAGQGITVQPDTLRKDTQKALLDAKISISSLFPEEYFEVNNSASASTKNEPTVQNTQEYKHPSNIESSTTREHSYSNSSGMGEIGNEIIPSPPPAPPATAPTPAPTTDLDDETPPSPPSPPPTPSATAPAPTKYLDDETTTSPPPTPPATTPTPAPTKEGFRR